MRSVMTCHIFVGPTGFEVNIGQLAPDVVVHAPAKRGDLPALCEYLNARDAVAVVDGRLGDVMSVSHRDVLRLLDREIQVWGIASMGALRAAEMHRFGMRPFGQVAQGYVDDPRKPDDEVVLMHAPEEPYFPVSEPMVHLDCFLKQCVGLSRIKSSSAEEAGKRLRSMWFGYRDWDQLQSILIAAGEDPTSCKADAHDIRQSRIKTRDLVSFLEERPWEHA